MKTLIVIDMQNDFVTGPLGTPEAVAILPNVERKIKEYVRFGLDVIFTQDTHFDNYLSTNEGKHLPIPHCIRGTSGHDIVPSLNIPESEHIQKGTFGLYGDGWTDILDLELADEYDIEIIGVCTDICVITNALILKTEFPEANITVDASCCAGTTPEAHEAALKVMKSCQINVIGE